MNSIRKKDRKVLPSADTPNDSFASKISDSDSFTSLENDKSYRMQSEMSTKRKESSFSHSSKNSRNSGSKRTSQNSDLVLQQYTGLLGIICWLPQTIIKINHAIPVILKLYPMIIVPMISLIAISIVFLIPNINSLNSTNNSRLVVDSLNIISKASISLNLERAELIRFVAKGGSDNSNITKLISSTDITLSNLEDKLSKLVSTSKYTNNMLLRNREISTKLHDIRSNFFLNNNITQTIYQYNELSDHLDSSLEPLLWDPNFNIISMFGNTKKNLQIYISLTGKVRDLITYFIFSGKVPSENLLKDLTQLVGKRTAYEESLLGGREAFLNIDEENLVPNDVEINSNQQLLWFNDYSLNVSVSGINQTFTEVDGLLFLELGIAFITQLVTILDEQEVVMENKLQSIITTNSITISVLFLICVLSLVFSCIIICICADCIYRPWKFVMKKREEAIKSAVDLAKAIVKLDPELMDKKKLEQEDESLTPLQAALKQIALNFLYFQPYIPQSVIAAVRERGEIESSSMNPDTSFALAPHASKYSLSSSKKEESMRSRPKESHRNLKGPTPSDPAKSSTYAPGRNSLNYKDITVLIIDITEIHDLLEGFSPADILEAHSELMTNIYNIVHENKGVLEIIQDKFVCSFNAATSTIGQEKMACASAIKIYDIIENKLIPEWKKAEMPLLKCNMAIVSGNAFVGTMGNNMIRSFVTLAPMLSKLWKFVKLNHKYSTERHILIDDATAKKIELQFSIKVVDIVSYKHVLHFKKPELFFALTDQHTFKDDEWMYEYSELEKKKEIGKDEFIDAWRLMIRGEIDESIKTLESYKKAISGNETLQERNKEAIQRLEDYLKAKEAEKNQSER